MSTKDLAHQKWNAFSKHWHGYNETNNQSNTNRVHLNQVFANRSEDDEIYPLTVSEIAEAQKAAVMWYHHYLQHPGHTRLEETINAAMIWKGMRATIRSITKSCKTCQTNKKRKLKYGHLPAKTVIRIPWEA